MDTRYGLLLYVLQSRLTHVCSSIYFTPTSSTSPRRRRTRSSRSLATMRQYSCISAQVHRMKTLRSESSIVNGSSRINGKRYGGSQKHWILISLQRFPQQFRSGMLVPLVQLPTQRTSLLYVIDYLLRIRFHSSTASNASGVQHYVRVDSTAFYCCARLTLRSPFPWVVICPIKIYKTAGSCLCPWISTSNNNPYVCVQHCDCVIDVVASTTY